MSFRHRIFLIVDYGHFQNNQGSAPQPFSRGNNNQNSNRPQPQNVEIITQPQPQQQQQQQQQSQPQQSQRQSNTYVSSSFNVQAQDSYAPTVSSQDYNDNYNVNVQYDVDDTFPQTKPSSHRHPNGLKRQTDQSSTPHSHSAQDYFTPSSPFPFPNFYQSDRFVPSSFPSQPQRKLEPERSSSDRLAQPPPSPPPARPFAFPDRSFALPPDFQPFSSLDFPARTQQPTPSPSPSPKNSEALQAPKEVRILPKSQFAALQQSVPPTPRPAPSELRIVAKAATPSANQNTSPTAAPNASEVRILPKSTNNPAAQKSEAAFREEFSRYNYYDTTGSPGQGSAVSSTQSPRWVPLEVFAGFFQQPKQSPVQQARPVPTPQPQQRFPSTPSTPPQQQRFPSSPPPPQLQRPQPALSREQQQQERRQRIEQEELAKQQLYAEDLGPAEEVESDRQQRVYRGQPSSLGQVARDRDGLRHQPNTIQAPSNSRDKASVVSYATQQPPPYRLHFLAFVSGSGITVLPSSMRLESQTSRPATGTQITSPSSHVHEVSTAKLEAETSQSYINERGERLHGNYRDPAAPGATVNGKTPLPPIPWVDERATASPVVSTGTSDHDEDEDDDGDEDDDEDEDDGKKNKLTTKESTRNTVPSGDQDDDDAGFNEPDDEEFGPDSDKLSRRPNKNKKDEHESHIMISDFKLTTDPSPDHHHEEEETVTGAPEATLTRPSAHHHDEDDDGDEEQHQNHQEDDDHDDFFDPDLDGKPMKHKKAPAQSQSQPVTAGPPRPTRPPAPPSPPEKGFTPAQPGALGLDDDDDDEAKQGEYRPPESFFSDDFGKEFDNEDGTFGSLDFDYDKFIKEMDKGVDDKVQGLASSADKAGAAPAPAQRPRDADEAFFGDDPDDRKPSAPAQYPRTGYTSVPFSWDADGRKHAPGTKGKESGVYYDKYRASKSPFGSEAHRDMRYEKQGASTAKTTPKGFVNNPFADPNFNFERYVDTIAATTSRSTVTAMSTTTTAAPVRPPRPHQDGEEEDEGDDDDEDEEEEEENANHKPTRKSVLENNTVKSSRHKPTKEPSAERTSLAKNHRYEASKLRPAESAPGPGPAAHEYEDMVSEEDKRSAPKYPRSTERSVRSTTPQYSQPFSHTTAYSAYPRRGPYLGEFSFQQASPNNMFLPRPRASAASSSAPRERFAERVAPSAAVTRPPGMAVESSSFSTYGPTPLQRLRQEAQRPRTVSSNSVTSSKPRTKTKNRQQDDDMKEYYDVLGYTDEYRVENVHLAPTDGYDDLNPLKHIYPDIKAHIGLADHDHEEDEGPRVKANQYQ
ncbi:hypothetical protein FOCC_FOCC008623, partial [Frankliniella occidentalis]